MNTIAALVVVLAFVPVGCGPDEPAPSDVAVPAEVQTVEQAPVSESPGPISPWHTYHGGPSLDGVATANLPATLELKWRFMAGAPVRTTPVGGSGRIFFANTKGQVFAIDMDGAEVWAKSFVYTSSHSGTVRDEAFDAPLVYMDDAVIAAGADGTLYSLSTEDGEERWKTETDGMFLGSPNLHMSEKGPPRLLVIEQGFGVLHCFDWTTGKPLWQTEGVDRCDGSPGVGGGVAVFGSCAAALHVFSAETGEFFREVAIDEDSQVAGGVTVIGDSAFSGSRSGKVLHANTKTGAMVWINDENEDEIFTTPAVDDAHVVFGSADGVVACLDRATGVSQWSVQTDGMASSPVIVGDKVVVASDGTLHLFGLNDGEALWSMEVSDDITSPGVIGNLVVVGSDDGTVAAFGPASP
ncbi:MAG: PQQ-binding-like beta-propeller repeat protein [bacterium]|nr:PQQ-binding-like beta-propeller repeat protein [bacterium]